MAFNLNKNEAGNSSKKFDLSKGNISDTANTEQAKSSSTTWLFVVAGLLVAAAAAWYFLSDSGSHQESGTTATATDSNMVRSTTSNQDPIAATAADTAATVKKEDARSSTLTAANNNNTVTAPAPATGTSFNHKVPATFAKGSNRVSNLDRSLVKDIIAFLEKNSAALVTVNGYASSEGDPGVNQQISQARADAFKNYLVSKGIHSGRIHSVGKGIDNPIASNDTEAGRVKNRRVEIVFP